MNKKQLFGRLIRAFRPYPLAEGFAIERQGIFQKEINDVILYVVMYRVAECDPNLGIAVQYEFCVLSPALLFLTAPDVKEAQWGYSQIRATFSEVTKETWDSSSIIELYCQNDVTDKAIFAGEVLRMRGKPFLEKINSTERILDLYRQQHYSALGKSKHRGEYEIAAWNGEIDPATVRFSEWLETK